MYRIIPLFDRVLCERCIDDEYITDEDGNVTTKAGVSVTPDSIEKHSEYKVVKMGPLCKELKKCGVKEGDIVLLGQMSGVMYKKSMIVYEGEILAKLEEMEVFESE